MITPKQAEVLSYLQGCGPVGHWVQPSHFDLCVDLDVGRVRLQNLLAPLIEQKLIDYRVVGWRAQYKVLRRLESGVKIGCKKPGRPMNRPHGWREPRKLIPYAGAEVRA